MYAVSENYISAIRARTRSHRLVGQIVLTDGTEVPLSRENIKSDSAEIEKSCVTGEELQFGNVILSELRIDIRTELSRYLFFDAKITLNYELQLTDGTWASVPLGMFRVGEAERNKDTVSMIAYDNLITLDDEYGGAVLYGTPYEILLAISEQKGIPLANSEEEINALPNGGEKIQIDETSDCENWRDCVKIVCQMTGTFGMADREGKLWLRQFGKEPVESLSKSDRFRLTASDFEVSYIGLIIKSSTATYTAYDPDAESGLEMTIQDAPAWDYGLEETLQARAETLLQELLQIKYTPCEMSMVADPRYDCGDRVALPLDDGTVIESIITKISWKLGNMDVVSTGKNPILYGMTPKKAQVIRQLQTQTTENKLIFYSFTNQNAVSVRDGDEEEQVAQVTFVTTKPTSAMFIAQLPVVAECADTVASETVETERTVAVKDATGASVTIPDANGNPLTLTVVDADTVKTVTQGFVDVQVEYYLDGTLVDYQLVQRCRAGQHIIGLFYAFDSLDGNANYQWQVKIRVVGGAGTVTVPKRGFRATVTGQGMAGTEAWDGTLSFDESVAPISMASTMKLVAVTEEYSVNTQIPTPANFEERIGALSMRSRMTLVGFTEELSVNPTWEQQTITPTTEALPEWEYAARFVGIGENGLQLNTVWEYKSEEQRIDTGRMTAVKAVTNDLASVTGMEEDAE